jgi:pimeloyl-ACP methyl ester carboxylesterase
MAEISPIIFVHGILGSHIVNANSLDYDDFYSANDNVYLQPDQWKLSQNPDFDLADTVLVEKNKLTKDLPIMGDFYGSFFVALKRDFPGKTYIFTYDWRKSNAENAKRLGSYVQHLAAKLSRNRDSSPGVVRFHFVTHSMGGLVFSGFLGGLKNGDYPGLDLSVIDRAILVACPFLGSLEALKMLLIGKFQFLLDLLPNLNDRIRHVARTWPSVYELVATYPDAAVREEDQTNVDLTVGSNWQSNLFRDDGDQAGYLVSSRIGDMRTYRQTLFRLDDLPQDIRDRFLILAGTGEETLKKIVIRKNRSGVENFCDFDAPMKDNAGDNTVHLASSAIYKDSILTLSVMNVTHGGIFTDGVVQDILCRCLAGATPGANRVNWWDHLSGRVGKVV